MAPPSPHSLHPLSSIEPPSLSFLPFLLPCTPHPPTSTGLPIFCATVLPFLHGTRHLLPPNTSPIHCLRHHRHPPHRRHHLQQHRRHLPSWPVLFFLFFCCCCCFAATDASVFAVIPSPFPLTPTPFHRLPRPSFSLSLTAIFLPAPTPPVRLFPSPSCYHFLCSLMPA